ncbi:hypothetical protein QYE76_014219 [Lolium multiflorum]|uniref:Uncharacterized protein n=1 Tax=Lolium multiflorum TaxID=4521 RepID=A0AAD8U2L6_LOLMU|nr:hypothetical protein QYE76_014219 [Lolium multiflorum]
MAIHGDLSLADDPGAVAWPCASPWWSGCFGNAPPGYASAAVFGRAPCHHGHTGLELIEAIQHLPDQATHSGTPGGTSGQSSATTSTSASEMAEEPVKYEDLPPEHKKKYDDLKAILEADLIGAFEKTRSHGIKFKGFQPEGALDGLDLSLPSDERTRALRQEVNYAVAHSLHRHSESLVNTLERVALNVVQEVMKHKYSPSGPALGTHQGEIPLYTRPPLPYTTAAPQQPGSPAYVVYKVGGDPGDYQFLYEPPKEIPHGYVCTYVPDCNDWMTQRNPELYQDKYKRVALIETDEDEDSAGDQEVAVAEWTRGAKPVSCKWVKQPGPAKGFDFDLSKTEQIFDLLLKEKQLKLPEGHKIPTPQEMNGRPYCKWHHTFTHATNDCKVLRGQIQMAIEQGRLLFGQFAMRVDTQPFPDVNMVDLSHCIRREPGFSFDINMAGLADRHGMSRLPTIENCPECKQKRKGTNEVSVFKRLGPLPPQNKRAESSQDEDFEESEEEDRYHRPRWCPDGLSHSQKRRVQRLRNLEEAEAQYLYTLRKARPDLAVKIQQTLETEARPPKKVWRPKKADAGTSADTNMVFVLPSEFCAPRDEEVSVAQFDCGPRPVIFEKPREKSYRHLKALYLKGYINGQPISKMLVDTGAAVNIMPYSMLRRLGRSTKI